MQCAWQMVKEASATPSKPSTCWKLTAVARVKVCSSLDMRWTAQSPHRVSFICLTAVAHWRMFSSRHITFVTKTFSANCWCVNWSEVSSAVITETLRCLQKEMTYRHWSVSLWQDSDDVPHCRIPSLTKLNGGLSRLHSADEEAVSWLTNYGSWHAYEKKITDIQSICCKFCFVKGALHFTVFYSSCHSCYCTAVRPVSAKTWL